MSTLSNLFLFLILFCTFSVEAVETNINEVTDLFDRNIEDKDALFQEMEQQNKNAYENVKNQKDFQYIPGMDEQASEANRVSNISAYDLESEGRNRRHSKEMRFYDDNELEPDYSKPGNKMHFDDMADIAATLDKKLVSILELLKKEMNVDCETVKGPIEKEPVHYIEMQREMQKNTEYDQMFCEELRNKYSCNDELRMRCKRKGMKWHPWQKLQTMQMVYNTMPGYWWFRGLVMDKNSNITNYGDYGWSQSINFSYRQEITQEIAKRLGVSSEQIDVGAQEIYFYPDKLREHQSRNVDFSNCECWSNWGQTHYLVDNAIITFHYQYRDATQICTEWQEEWHERCELK